MSLKWLKTLSGAIKKDMNKKEIQSVLRTLNRTAIFKAAKQHGVNVNDKWDVLQFIKDHAPSQKVKRKAWDIAFYVKPDYSRYTPNTIESVFNFAKLQKKAGHSSYSKMLIIGNKNIYWASPSYGHADYNKSIALPNTERNRRAAALINHYLGYNTELCK